jgi:uncharacterized protein
MQVLGRSSLRITLVALVLSVALFAQPSSRTQSPVTGDPISVTPGQFALLKEHADAGDILAQFTLGMILSEGAPGIPRDMDGALRYLKLAHDAGSSEAAFRIGNIYGYGLGVNKDLEEGFRWMLRAAEAGHPYAQNYVGQAYAKANGVGRDFKEAVIWYRRAAEHGHRDAQHNLAVCFEEGRGIEQDFTQALVWFRRAAEQGFVPSQNVLGHMYARGHGTEKNEAEGLKWYMRAAEQGDPDALYNIGRMYLDGRGVEKSTATGHEFIARAVTSYTALSERGDAQASYYLGFIHAEGYLGEEDIPKAMEWYVRAADQGSITALNDMAWILATKEKFLDGKKAVEYAERAVNEHPDNANYIDTLAAAYYAAGRYQQAVDAQVRAMTMEAAIPEADERLKKYKAAFEAIKN